MITFFPVKKKWLLANKHIAKLNATLSVRINGLTAQISILHAENAQLRSSEISLLGQLRREKDISRTIIVEAESAPPNVPGIYEEDEPCLSDDQQLDEQPKSRKGRLSASKLPIRIRGSSPVPPRVSSSPPRQMDFTTMTKRPSRRQSALLQVTRKEKEKEKRRAKATEWDARQPAEWDTQPKEEGPSASKKSKSGTNASTSGTRRKVLLPVDNIEAPTRTFLASSPPRTSRVPSPPSPQPSSSTHKPPAIHQPTSNLPYRPNSRCSPTPPPDSDLEGFAGDTESSTGGGRERRVRKKAKMRKPDGAPGSSKPRKRASAAAVLYDDPGLFAVGLSDQGRYSDRLGEETEELRSSAEFPLRVDPAMIPSPSSRRNSSTS
ncbi:hypothetical protein C8J56DRAFT_1095040 [Mycena floridula]|nr:hypothetical protein C8J56DRAFT_1095040 [Mycena floridula]